MKPRRLTKEARSYIRYIPVENPRLSLKRFPDFFLAGPHRTGATWLHQNLKRHPQIFLPRMSDRHFFSSVAPSSKRRHSTSRQTLDDYLWRMKDSRLKWLSKQCDSLITHQSFYRPKCRGEASATYASLPEEIIDEITLLNPDVKCIVMLRHPVERAWSDAVTHLLNRTRRSVAEVPPAEFTQFFHSREQLDEANYVQVLDTWSRLLKPGHLFAGLFDHITGKPAELLRAVHEFLGVRSGNEYFHFRMRVPPDAFMKSIPGYLRDYLFKLLERECAYYERLKDDLNFGGTESGILTPGRIRQIFYSVSLMAIITPL